MLVSQGKVAIKWGVGATFLEGAGRRYGALRCSRPASSVS
jgi:hypothetical protein